MPRLLLVDDNPSIHRIAESLLTGSTVELVCVESGEEALRRVNAGEPFDVALLDTVLGPGGMDGWALLDRLRSMPTTATLPIALMAGVLDAVDPLKLEQAPIQGFLRKPIELRDLEERIRAYMAAPVERVGRTTAPGAKLQDWMSQPAAAAPPASDPGPEGDLLVLTAEDLLEMETAVEATGVHAGEPELHIEDLDLETLHGTSLATMPSGAPDLDELPPIPSLNLDEPLSHEMLAELSPLPAGAPPKMEALPETPPAAPSAVAPAASGEAQAMVQAILADPAARQALLKALLTQGGEQVFREVAWEVMPDLAAKLQK